MADAKNSETRIYSEDVQDIMGQVPSGILRWGIASVAGVLLVLLVGAWIFSYPDIIRAPAVVTTMNPPAKIIARSSGRIEQLFVKDSQYIAIGEVLGLIENPANYDHMQSLKGFLTRFQEYLVGQAPEYLYEMPDTLQLGDLQQSFSRLQKQIRTYKSFLELGYYPRKIESLHQELSKYQVYYNRVYRQRNLLERELGLTQKQFSRDSGLFRLDVIAEAEYEKAQTVLLQKRGDFEQSRINLSTISIKISELEQEILDLELQEEEEINTQQNELIETYNNLRSEWVAWEQKYLLKSSQGGLVSFNKYWSDDQYVEEGEEVLSIIPANPGRIIGRLNLNQFRAGKVKEGYKVFIKFENFPYLEYGSVTGVVENISDVPQEGAYTVEIGFPDGLKTNYMIDLQFSQEMEGTAEIITDERPLLYRLLDPLKYIWERNLKR